MINRRSLLKLGGAVLAWRPFARFRVLAQAAPAAAFTQDQIKALFGIAEVALPSAVDADGRDGAVRKFVAWHVNYREGADMGHGYGNSTLRPKSGPPVAPRYSAQFASLDQAARAQGAASFAAAPAAVRRSIVEAALNAPTPINRLPARPTGANLVADFTGMYFNSAGAFDLAYQAAIGRDDCRDLEGSDQPPAPIGGR
ncbi:MAG: hypothetical protein EPO35_04295 [Acidobacteria bacterium]|nr:MAG: hypothetical protein EPO35_04295 [Acidobacteriota bacterium]